MTPSDIGNKMRDFLEKKDGWAGVEDCAKAYSMDPIKKKIDFSKRRKFYRWRKQVGKGKVEGFRVVPIQRRTFLGLTSADPSLLKSFLDKDKSLQRSFQNSLGFWGYWDRRAERKAREKAKKLLSLKAECYALIEETNMIEDEWTPEKVAKLRQKYRKLLKDS